MKPDHNTEDKQFEVQRELAHTSFVGTKTTNGKFQRCTWAALASALADPTTYPTKAACALMRFGTFAGNSRASGSKLLSLDVLQVDYDAGLVSVAEAAERLRRAGVRALIYTTPSHQPERPRWRIVAPLAASITEDRHEALVDLLNGAVGGILAVESWHWTRCYYVGRVEGAAYETAEVEGECIDIVATCPDFDPIACPTPPKATREIDRSTIVTDDPVVAFLEERGMVLGGAPGKVFVTCPKEDLHSTDTGPSGTAWLLATATEPSHFSCRHTSHGSIGDTEFLGLVGYSEATVIDDFSDCVLPEEQAAESAAAAIRNAKRSSGLLETEAERSARIGREGTHQAPTQRVMTGTEMLEELVYIADGARVSFAAEPRYALPFNEFKSLTAGSLDTVGKRRVHRAQRWLESPDRKTVRTQTFAPGRPAMCVSPDNVPAQTLWLPRIEEACANWRELVAPFFEHVAYLVPIFEERERFLDWLAHIEQAPGVLPSTHYLLVAKQTGIGRNWLAYALARAFAGHTALGFDLGEALRSGFNGALSQKLLAVVDELHEGGPGGMGKPVAEKLKSMLTEATRRVNPKFGRQHVEFNCCRFLMFSNHESALPLAENDRRVVVLENPSARRDAGYYGRLYAMLETPGLGAALAAAFRARDIGRFNPGEVAPMSEAKARTIRAGRSEVEQAVRDVASEWPSACITSTRLQHAVSEALGSGKSWSTQGACVAAGLVKFAGRVKVGGIPSHVWLLRDQRRWAGLVPADVAAEVLRGEAETCAGEFA